ncbi:MAG: UDP-glucose/GDP-mannose dehydrogenase family protein [Clostridiales Family XIII bacterium]|jgi:UDPglucose 6-dehydrogenase|nr:UDP-glucose/GDP-mannose dehydrogenase family protein [Clostridiales Family XIII bacterium]
MRIAVIGTGYVGLVTGACFSEMGNDVYCVDADENKIESLKSGIIPIYEPGLSAMVAANAACGRLKFTTSLPEAIKDSELCFIAVGTPMDKDGGADLRYVLAVAKEIGQNIDKYLCVVDKSTVPVGTADKVRAAIRAELDRRGVSIEFDVASNPEFLKEGAAITDCMRPDRVVIGADSERAAELLRTVYEPYVRNTGNFLIMDIASAEMTKYAANAMLAAKISFMNEIAGICERVGADVNKVRLGIGSDSRIGYSFIYPGCGYGGSCFPKDVEALIKTAEHHGFSADLLKSVTSVNDRQKHVIGNKVKAKFGNDLIGRKFAVWGLAFKPDTDDMRESSAITIIRDLVEAGATVAAYDPKAADEAKNRYLKDLPNIDYCDSKYDTLRNSDAMILVTEWKEFRSPDFYEIKKRLKIPVIFDGRNQYDAKLLDKIGIEYHQIGVKR